MNTPDTGDYFWQGEKVRLRAGTKEDADAWIESHEDSDARRYMQYGIELPPTREKADEMVEKYSSFRSASERIMFSIDNMAGEHVGAVNIHTMDQENGTFGTGMIIYRQHRRKGYADEAKRIVLRYCFFELRMQKYNVACMEINEAEIAHLKKIGCIEEGRRRRDVYTNGRYYDAILFGLTREEFEENAREMRR
jgi:RimJ/RimL family protein N-acetyltransferase